MYWQGSFDNLCGIYSCINSISLMVDIDAEALFYYLIDHMDGHLPSVMLHGLRTAQLRRLVLAACRRFCAEQRIDLSYRTCQSSSLNEYWQTLQDHIAKQGPGSVILGVDEHWTCIRHITSKTILLADSIDWKRLCRRHVSIRCNATHQLFPNATFLLNICEVSRER